MFILDSLLIGSLRFVLDKVVQAAEAEMQDDSALRDQLLEAQMRLELGEITDEEFAETERDILAAIREIKRPQQGAISMSPNSSSEISPSSSRICASSSCSRSDVSSCISASTAAATLSRTNRSEPISSVSRMNTYARSSFSRMLTK